MFIIVPLRYARDKTTPEVLSDAIFLSRQGVGFTQRLPHIACNLDHSGYENGVRGVHVFEKCPSGFERAIYGELWKEITGMAFLFCLIVTWLAKLDTAAKTADLK